MRGSGHPPGCLLAFLLEPCGQKLLCTPRTLFVVALDLLEERLELVVITGIVVLTYSGLALGVLPGQPGVSWQSHLFGALAGVAVAWFGATPARRPRRLDR
jgi:membrane associated rhomboid family serine protease